MPVEMEGLPDDNEVAFLDKVVKQKLKSHKGWIGKIL